MAEIVKDERFEKPREESSCRIVLESPSPCAYPRFLYQICHAWYRVKSRPEPTSMREVFVEGLKEARALYEERCRA